MDIPSQRSFAAIFLVACNCLCGKTVLYVSVEGDDANPGTAARPFASIDAARDAVRELKRSGRADGPITVKLGSGRFRLDTALEFYPRDSGTEDAPVRYEGAGRGRTIVTGGVTVDGWREEADGTWSARVEAVKQQKVYFNQLFVNGRRARRAVTPNKFYLRTAGPLKALGNRREAKKDNSTKVGFRFTEGDLSAWQNPDDVMITLYHSWTASLHWISAIDFDRGTVRFTNRSGWPVSYWERRQRYQVENFREALDSPGEWYLDRKTGILEYFPLPGENMNTSSAVAPVLTELVRFQGDPENGAFVEYITFKGISFMHAGWRFDRTKPVDGQAHCSPKSSAIKAYGLRYSCFEDCEIAHVGSHAIWLEKGCQENRISHCHIHDAGGGGVYIGEGGKVSYMPPDEALQVRGNVVDNTIIHDITHVLHGSIGIWVGSSSENTLSHNDISDFDYTGISVGWSWSRKEEIFQHSNIIEYNRVHHNGKEILSDNGGIYVLGCSPGSVIRGNLIHDVRHYPYINASRGIYLDGNTSRYLIENNVCCRIGSYGITVKGDYNTVRNNIFAFCGECGLDRRFKAHAKSFDYDQDLFRSNVVLQKISNMTLGYFYEKWTDIDRNLYWSTQFGNAVVFNDISARLLEGVPQCSDVSFEEWQALGRDTHSLVADPRFVDPHEFDFRTRGDSPVSEIGFEPIPVDSAGV